MTSTEEKTKKLPVACLDRHRIPLEHQFEALRQATQPIYDAIPVGAAKSTGASARIYRLGEVLLGHLQFGEIRFSRDRRLLANGDADNITVQWYREGAIHGELADGTPLHIAPHRVVLQDFAHGYAGIGQSRDHIGLVIPRHLLRERDRVYEQLPVIDWAADSPQGRILTDALQRVWEGLPGAGAEDGPALASQLVGLLDGLIAKCPSPEQAAEVRRGITSAMQRYLREDLRNPKLGAEDLCRAFDCSRATVYRVFQPHGGVRTYLRNQRLNHCFQELAAGSDRSHRRVRNVAEHWGFFDPSHFHRVFKARFGFAPSELLDADRQPEAAPPGDGPSIPFEEVNRLRGWLTPE